METNNVSGVSNAVNLEQPRVSIAMAANQKLWQWVGNSAFYAMLPSPYMSFYSNWVRQWLYWYDGYVPYIHGVQNGLLSTCIGTTLVNRCTDTVFGGNIMFANARKPLCVEEKNGKRVGLALDFINNWIDLVGAKSVLKRFGKDAMAGGFSILKLNRDGNNELWLDALRADRFFLDKVGNEIRRCVSIVAFYDAIADKNNGNRYMLVEERRFEEVGIGKEIPVVEYKIYRTSVQIQYFVAGGDNSVPWEQLPKDVRRAFKNEYGECRLNQPVAMEGFEDLGVYVGLASDGVSNVPQIGLGESILANVMAYLYEYDFYNTCFNTDMYLARGRILLPKFMQNPNARYGNQNEGFDEFIYTKVEMPNTGGETPKPEPIQFALRSSEWKEARNILLESIATGIGISTSTLASYLNDGSNRTAREVSAEESATTLFVENMRRRLEIPINHMLRTVLRFYGYVDDVEIRWTRAGMTNQTVLVDNLARAVAAGLISRRKAHSAFNFDDDEEQNNEDYALVEKEQAQAQSSLFGMGDEV